MVLPAEPLPPAVGIQPPREVRGPAGSRDPADLPQRSAAEPGRAGWGDARGQVARRHPTKGWSVRASLSFVGIRVKLGVATALVSALAVTAGVIMADTVQERDLERAHQQRIELIASFLQAGVLNHMLENNAGGLHDFFQEFGLQNPDARAALVSLDGRVIAATDRGRIGRLQPGDHRPDYDGPVYRIRDDGDDPRTSMIMPLPNTGSCSSCHSGAGPRLGFLQISLSRLPVRAVVERVRQTMAFGAIASLGLLLAATWMLLSMLVVHPVRALAGSMRRAQDGDLSVRARQVSVGPADEIAWLTDSFNGMLARIAELQRRVEASYRQRLDRAERFATVGELASSLAHEIKNPLAGLSGAVQIMTREFEDNAEKREIFEEMQRQIERLDRTMEDLLRFSRPRPSKLERVEVGPVLMHVLSLVRKVRDAGGIEINTSPAGDAAVLADHDQLEQVLLNLCLNAVQALGGKGTLSISAREEGDVVAIEVADDGPGIPLAIRGEVFKPFFTTKTTGSGLGLAICARIVAEHGGRIDFECPPLGGTRFTLRLPRVA
jgi:signal transduction histidine kinase